MDNAVHVLARVAVAAALWHAVAATGQELVAARFFMGLGWAASIMGAVTLCASWCPGERLSSILSLVSALGQIGIFVAATPLANA